MRKVREKMSPREKLLAERDACLAKMSPELRRAFRQRRQSGVELLDEPESSNNQQVSDSQVARQVQNLLTLVQHLRQVAQSKSDIRVALRAVDTMIRALQLWAKVTGELTISRRGSKPTVDSVASREEGIQTATDLLLALATAEEVSAIIPQLERRRLELFSASADATSDDNNSEDGSAEPAGAGNSPDASATADSADFDPGGDE